MALRRWNGMSIRAAASDCETPSGSRNSLSSISPGWVGGRLVGNIVISSVVVCTPHIVRVLPFETENRLILIIDADCMIPREVAGQRV